MSLDGLTLLVGDVRQRLATLEDGSVDCVITSPPYWGLRDYSVDGQLGLEATPDLYVQNMVQVFREIRRVLADHGTCWVNLGDRLEEKQLQGVPWRVAFALQHDGWYLRADVIWAKPNPMPESVTDRPTKAHEYVFLLSKRPRYWFDAEAVREPHNDKARPNGLDGLPQRHGRRDGVTVNKKPSQAWQSGGQGFYKEEVYYNPAGRNIRSVWEIATQPYPEAHFATYPEELVRQCLLAGCPERVCVVCGRPSERIVERGELVGRTPNDGRGYELPKAEQGGAFYPKASETYRPNARREVSTLGWSDCGHNTWRRGVVLDPFLGSGTTALVARKHGRHCVGIELNPAYAEQALRRLRDPAALNRAALSSDTHAQLVLLDDTPAPRTGSPSRPVGAGVSPSRGPA